MMRVDVSFDEKTIEMCRSLLGLEMECFFSDPFIYTSDVFGIVGFYVGGETFKLTCESERLQRFFAADDVAVMRFSKCERRDIVSKMDDGEMISHPIKDVIYRIDIVNDYETVRHEGDCSEFVSTKGIIFYMESGNEVSFEVGTWFSEMITIRRGYRLSDRFVPVSEFYEEWDENSEYKPDCNRKIITLM